MWIDREAEHKAYMLLLDRQEWSWGAATVLGVAMSGYATWLILSRLWH